MSTVTRTLALALAFAATSLGAVPPAAGDGTRIALPGPPTAAAVTDADRDGALDLLVALGAGPRLVLLRGDGTGAFGAPEPLGDLPAADGTRLLGLAAADVDRDGDLDLVGAGAPPTLWLAAGDGTFEPVALRDEPASHVAVGDLDGDGGPEILLVGADGLAALRNDGVGRFAPSVPLPTDGVWPVTSLRTVERDGATLVVVRGGAADAALVWRGRPDGTLEALDPAGAPAPEARDTALARADLDGDGLPDLVAAAPEGAAALLVTTGASGAAPATTGLDLVGGRLRRPRGSGDSGTRVLVRARLPAAATGVPTRVALGDPAGPFVLDLPAAGWTAETPDVDVWDDASSAHGASVVVDRERGTVSVSASHASLPVVPEETVEVVLSWPASHAVSRAPWRRTRQGDLVYRAARTEAPSVTAAAPSASAPLAPGERSADGFRVTTVSVDGQTVTLVRDRRTGRTWRLAADGAWLPAAADGRLLPGSAGRAGPAAARATVDLHFRGIVDGSDEIRLDAGGATWTNRYWGVREGTVELNGVTWAPRHEKTLANSGGTRFLPDGVDYASARLVSRSGRDVLALETGDGHALLRICDSVNGAAMYDAVIRFETTGPGMALLDTGLLAHLPLAADASDVAAPEREAAARGVRYEGGAAVFAGQGWVDLPYVALADRPFAVSMRVRVDGDAATMGLLEQRAGNARDKHLHLMLRGGQRPYFGFYMDDLVAPEPVARDGAFHHLVFQFTGDEKEIWMDGERVAHARSGPYRGTSGATRIGRNPGWNDVGRSHLVGALRDVRIYGRSLSAAEVAALAR